MNDLVKIETGWIENSFWLTQLRPLTEFDIEWEEKDVDSYISGVSTRSIIGLLKIRKDFIPVLHACGDRVYGIDNVHSTFNSWENISKEVSLRGCKKDSDVRKNKIKDCEDKVNYEWDNGGKEDLKAQVVANIQAGITSFIERTNSQYQKRYFQVLTVDAGWNWDDKTIDYKESRISELKEEINILEKKIQSSKCDEAMHNFFFEGTMTVDGHVVPEQVALPIAEAWKNREAFKPPRYFGISS